MRCSTVILNWNTKDLLKACLDNLFKHTNKDDFKVFQDNARIFEEKWKLLFDNMDDIRRRGFGCN